MRLTILASCLLATFATSAEGLSPPPEADIVLAENYQSGINIDEYWYSEKLDGIRAYWTGEQLQTRSGKKIHAPAWFVQALPNYPLDGELWAGRGHFHLVQQTVLDTSPIDQAWQQIRFMLLIRHIPQATTASVTITSLTWFGQWMFNISNTLSICRYKVNKRCLHT